MCRHILNILFSALMLARVFLVILARQNIYKDDFNPQIPVLRSDIGLLSVNVPPIQLREQYWLHTVAIEMPCLDAAITPNLMVLTNEMNYSTQAIMAMAHKIQIQALSDDSRQRVLGPVKALNSTYNIFTHYFFEVRRKYQWLSGDPMALWGALDDGRCSTQVRNDIELDASHDVENVLPRKKRQSPDNMDTKKHNVFNIEGTGHTFVFNHGPTGNPNTSDYSSPYGFSSGHTSYPTPDPMAESIHPKYGDGRLFARIQQSSDQGESAIVPPCVVPVEDRLKYLTCAIDFSRPEHTCYRRYMVCLTAGERQKRGLFNFLGDFQNSLFGVATEDQVTKLHDLINDIGNATFENTESIKILRNSTMSMSQHLLNAMQDLSKNIYSELDKLTASIHSWSTDLESSIKRMEDRNQETATLLSLSTATATMQTYIHLLTRMTHTLDYVERYYVQLSEIANHNVISTELLTPTYARRLWNTVNEALKPELELASQPNKLQVIQSNIFQIYATTKHMVILVKIPVIIRPQNVVFWEPRTVPIIKDNKAYQLHGVQDMLIINSHLNQWTSLRVTDYLLSYTSATKMCTTTLVWEDIRSPNCHLSIHQSNSTQFNGCFVREVDVDIKRSPFMVSSDYRTWLVSSHNDKGIAEISCTGVGSLPSRRSTTSLPLLGLVQVPPHCSLSMNSRTIHSPYTVAGSSTNEIRSLVDMLDMTYDDVIINNLTTEVPFLLHNTMHKFEITKRPSDTLFTAETIEINNLNHKMEQTGKIFANTIDKIKNNIIQDEKNYNKSLSSITNFFGNLTIPDLLIPIPSLYNIIVFTWLIWLTYKNFCGQHVLPTTAAAMSLMPNSLMKHQSYAQPIGTVVAMEKNITSCLTHDIRNIYRDILIWVPLVCVVLMILMHCHIVHTVKHYSKKVSHRLGWVPINRKTIQHSGENGVLVGFLLKFSTPWHTQLTRRQIVIQVATLPGRVSSWYVDNSDVTLKSTVTGRFTRLSNEAKFVINWDNVCIKSRDYADLDTCQDMPKVIHVHTSDLYCHIKEHLPWLWWWAEAESITCISLSRKTDSVRIFDYSHPN